MKIVVESNVEDALVIIREAAEWLERRGIPLWNPTDFTLQNISASALGNYFTAYSEGVAAAAMIFQWEDPDVWPNSKSDSGFIHKLAVKREFAGTGVVGLLIDWAKQEVSRRGRTYLRLDCAVDRIRLRTVYENLGFINVGERHIGKYQVALYEIRAERKAKLQTDT